MLLPLILLQSAVSLPAHRAVIGRAASLALGAGAGLAPALAVSEISETVLVPPADPASPTPQRAQKVAVDYTLWIGGFDKKHIGSSKGSAFPPRLPAPFVFSVGVGEVIPGWDRTVKQMRAGETRRVVVPASLGYGEKGIGPIPGGADLYIEISLLELKSPPKLTEQQLAWLSSHAEP